MHWEEWADRADAFAKIGNIFRQKLPQTNKGASGIYGNRNKTDFSSPVKFVLLSPRRRRDEICHLCRILLWCRVKSLLMFVPLDGNLGSKVEHLGSKPIFRFQTLPQLVIPQFLSTTLLTTDKGFFHFSAVNKHTWYLAFLLNRQDFWIPNFTPKNYENYVRDKYQVCHRNKFKQLINFSIQTRWPPLNSFRTMAALHFSIVIDFNYLRQ